MATKDRNAGLASAPASSSVVADNPGATDATVDVILVALAPGLAEADGLTATLLAGLSLETASGDLAAAFTGAGAAGLEVADGVAGAAAVAGAVFGATGARFGRRPPGAVAP